MRISILKNITWALLAAVLLSCSSTPPAKHKFESKTNFSGSFDGVWVGVMETFADMNLSITTLEKDSGLVAARAGGIDESFLDCGKPGMGYSFGDAAVSFNVFVKSLDDNTQVVTITSDYSASVLENKMFSANAYSHPVHCNSTGLLEQTILSTIKSKL